MVGQGSRKLLGDGRRCDPAYNGTLGHIFGSHKCVLKRRVCEALVLDA